MGCAWLFVQLVVYFCIMGTRSRGMKRSKRVHVHFCTDCGINSLHHCITGARRRRVMSGGSERVCMYFCYTYDIMSRTEVSQGYEEEGDMA